MIFHIVVRFMIEAMGGDGILNTISGACIVPHPVLVFDNFEAAEVARLIEGHFKASCDSGSGTVSIT